VVSAREGAGPAVFTTDPDSPALVVVPPHLPRAPPA
jgi:hypothetical protein